MVSTTLKRFCFIVLCILSTTGQATESSLSTPVEEPPRDIKTPHWLVIDDRNQGYALIAHQLANNRAVTAFVPYQRRDDLMRFFGRNPLLTIVCGDVTRDHAALAVAARNATHLFFAPEFEPYTTWHDNILAATSTCLTVTRRHRLALVYPGRTFPFDGHEADASGCIFITPHTPYKSISRQGGTLIEVEHRLRQHAQTTGLPVTIIRTGTPFGQRLEDTLTHTTFRDAEIKSHFLWLFRDNVPHQFCDTGSIARLADLVAHQPPATTFTVLPLSGYTFPAALDFGHAIAGIARNKPCNPWLISSWKLRLVSLAKPDARRGSDVRRSFECSFLVDDTSLYSLYPDFQPISLKDAITETLAWHKRYTSSV